MTENKRFEIKPSAMYNNKYVIHDSEKEYTFPILDSTLNYMFCKAMNELHDENEQLKQKIKGVYELLTLEVDVFTDKATEHDINAFRELQQLDNKDAFFMATATKKAIKMLKGDVE